MFFKTFNPMTPEEVDKKVAAKPKADACCACDCLAGKTLKLKFVGPLAPPPPPPEGAAPGGMFGGPPPAPPEWLDSEFAPKQLDYAFIDGGKLTVIENGTSYEAPYTAQCIGDIALFSHLIPGTSRGWHVVYDTRTELVTVFETWFGISVPVGGDLFGMRQPTHHREVPREIQRHYHFGWNDKGQPKPMKFHTTTNRIEGRGLHWDMSNGSEQLTYFPSVICSTTVLLDAPEDTVTVTYPSDYLRIDDEHFIFAKWGVEFAGEMWINVIDFFSLEAVGLKFGFDINEEIEYEFYCADVTITGDAAHLETITLNGDKAPPMAALQGKGARYAYRPKDMHPPMTDEEVAKAKAVVRAFGGSTSIMSSGFGLEKNYHLVGKKFSLTYDQIRTPYAWSAKNIPESGVPMAYEYDFADNEKLKWRVPGGEWHEENYICFEPAKDIYFFSHMLTGDPHSASIAQAVDFSTGLTTGVYARIGSWFSNWEASATVLFGYAEGEGIAPYPFSKRHDFTTDLIGKCLSWTYSDSMASIHVYSSPNSYSWTIFQNDNSGGATWSSPGFYIKLRDDAYLFQWVEENCNGGQGLICYNPQIQHDGGFFYSLGSDAVGLSTTGAYARNLGTFDIMKYFDKKGNI